MAYQQWKNHNFGKQPGLSYSINQEVREPPPGKNVDPDPHATFSLFSKFGEIVHKTVINTSLQSTNIYTKAVIELYPQLWRRNICYMLVLSNLASPEWLPVDCDLPITPNVLCIKEDFQKPPGETRVSMGCYAFHVKMNNTCFYFYPSSDVHTRSANTKSIKSQILEESWNISAPQQLEASSYTHLQHIFEAMQDVSQVPLEPRLEMSHGDHHETYIIFYSSFSHHPIGNNVFSCTDGTFVASKHCCDLVYDCLDKADEEDCTCQNIAEGKQCKYLVTCETNTTCGLLYQKTLNNTCHVFTHFAPKKDLIEARAFLCIKGGLEIDERFVNDLVPDCGADAEDEMLLKSVLSGRTTQCVDPGMIPCKEGHSKCFGIVDICTFSLDVYNILIPCRTGAHLKSCAEFECNMKYKCPGYYCINWAYVCDGKIDCPFAIDEQSKSCEVYQKCTYFYKCRSSKLCIHLGDVCDKKVDCPYQEDEDLCEAHRSKCPDICTCLTFAIKCTFAKIGKEDWTNKLITYVSISIQFSTISFLTGLVHKISNVIFLDLSQNNTSTFCPFQQNLKN